MTIRALAFAATCLILGSCARPNSDGSAGIARAYEAFQSAVPSERTTAAVSLHKAPCGTAESCADRDACALYASALAQSEDLSRRARNLAPVDAGGTGAATPIELARIVDGADTAVKDATVAQPACTRALSRLYARITR